MGKQNDKKVVKEARNLLISTLSNLLESERERKFTYKTKARHKSRKTVCKKTGLPKTHVTFIETGRLMRLKSSDLRPYFAALRGKDDHEFYENFKKIHEGLKAVDYILRKL